MTRDRDDEPRSEVDDEEGLTSRRRKDEIRDCRQAVRDWRRELLSARRMGQIDQQRMTALYGDRVREYLICIEPLLRDENLEGSQHVYHEMDLGTVEIRPPEELQKAAQSRRGHGGLQVMSNETVEPESVPIRGLRSIIELEVVGAEWECQVRKEDSNKPRQKIKEQRQEPIPRHILEKAVRVADNWLKQVGVGLDVGEGDPHGKT